MASPLLSPPQPLRGGTALVLALALFASALPSPLARAVRDIPQPGPAVLAPASTTPAAQNVHPLSGQLDLPAALPPVPTAGDVVPAAPAGSTATVAAGGAASVTGIYGGLDSAGRHILRASEDGAYVYRELDSDTVRFRATADGVTTEIAPLGADALWFTAALPGTLHTQGGVSVYAFDGGSFVWEVSPGSVKETIVLDRVPALRADGSAVLPIAYSGPQLVPTEDGGFTAGAYRIEPPSVHGYAAQPRWEPAPGGLVLVLPAGLLAVAEYPLAIDPTVTTNGRLTATAFGNGYHLQEADDGTLLVLVGDNGNNYLLWESADAGQTWTSTTVTTLASGSSNGGGIRWANGRGYFTGTNTSGHIVFAQFGGDMSFKVYDGVTLDSSTRATAGTATLSTALTTTTTYRQSFEPSVSSISKVQLYLGTTAQTGATTVTVTLYSADTNGRTAYTTTSVASKALTTTVGNGFSAAGWVDFTFTTAVPVRPNDRYVIDVAVNNTTDGVSLYRTGVGDTNCEGCVYRVGAKIGGTLSAIATLDSSTHLTIRPMVINDVNNRPAVVWTSSQSGGTKTNQLRFGRCKPTVTDCASQGNWTNVAGSSTFNGTSGWDVPLTYSGTNNTAAHGAIARMPAMTSGLNNDALYVFYAASDSVNFAWSKATVNGANYNAWTAASNKDTAIGTNSKPAGSSQSACTQCDLAIAPDSTNKGVVVAYSSGANNLTTVFRKNNGTSGTPDADASDTQLYQSSGAALGRNFSLFVNGSGNAYLAYASASPGTMNVRDITGAANTQIDATNTSNHASIWSLGANAFGVAYTQKSTAPTDVLFTRYNTDSTTPTVTITSPSANASVSGTLTITGTVSDTNFDRFYVEWGAGSSPGSWTHHRASLTAVSASTLATFNTASQNDGTYTFRITAVDKFNNSANATVTLKFANGTPSINSQSGSSDPAATLCLTHTLQNTGTAQGQFDITFSNVPTGWTAGIYTTNGCGAAATNPYTVAAAGSTSVYVGFTIPAGAPSGVYSPTVTATSVNDATKTSSQNDTVTVNQVAGAVKTADQVYKVRSPSSFCVRLTMKHTGNGTDTFNVSRADSQSGNGWTSALYSDVTCSTSASTVGSLLQDRFGGVYVKVTVPSGRPAAESNVTTLTWQSQFNTAYTMTQTITTTVVDGLTNLWMQNGAAAASSTLRPLLAHPSTSNSDFSVDAASTAASGGCKNAAASYDLSVHSLKFPKALGTGDFCANTFLSAPVGAAVSISTSDTNSLLFAAHAGPDTANDDAVAQVRARFYKYDGAYTLFATLTTGNIPMTASSVSEAAGDSKHLLTVQGTPSSSVTINAGDRIAVTVSVNVTTASTAAGTPKIKLFLSNLDATWGGPSFAQVAYTVTTPNRPTFTGNNDDDFTTSAAQSCGAGGSTYNTVWTCVTPNAGTGDLNAAQAVKDWLWLRNPGTTTPSNFGTTPTNTYLYRTMPTGSGNLRTVVSTTPCSTTGSCRNRAGLVLWTSDTDYIIVEVAYSGGNYGVQIDNSGTISNFTSLAGAYDRVWLGWTKTGTSFQATYSTDGSTWNNLGSAISHSTAFTRVALNVFSDYNAPHAAAFEWFKANMGDLTLSPNRAGTSNPSQTTCYTHTLTNTGGATDTYDFTFSPPAGWSATTWDGAACTGTNTTSFTLAASASTTVYVAVTAPGFPNPTAGSNFITTVTGTSQNSPSVSASVTETVTANAYVELTLDHDDGASPIDFGNVNPVTGTYTETLTATVKSNGPWSLKLFKVDPDGAGACTGDLTTGGAGCPVTIPSAQLEWKVGAGAYAQITATTAGGAHTAQSSGTGTASTAVGIDYRLTVAWTDAPGTYGTTHTYRLEQP